MVVMLQADGWSIAWQRANMCQLEKDGHQAIGITTHLLISVKRVRSICENAHWSAKEFEDFKLSAPGDHDFKDVQ